MLAQHNMSGLPVLDREDRMVDVVSESDLLPKAHGVDVPRSVTAGHLMTEPAVPVAVIAHR
ncbi:hypothetical protein OH809_04110 [Streptomyces sp. NBC_00873]|uniref:CBS domain-containing protein n=1 Tax=unclassified Streptomyces TaxID=2593676 RepID=UPI00386B1F37|nr:hypothetical protein OH809_04110 [Streptomyces sp. NBC_00873]WTA47958.1 hypothetical protein OH821_39690 [Streptomyces sp. NBC_00842]